MSFEYAPEKLPEELKSVEAALRGLTPSGGSIDRDRLMYLAGRASLAPTTRGRYAWPTAAAALFLLTLGLAGRLMTLSTPIERVVYVERAGTSGEVAVAALPNPDRTTIVSIATAPPTRIRGSTYMQLRNAVMNRGIDALPTSTFSVRTAAEQTAFPAWPSLRDNFLGS